MSDDKKRLIWPKGFRAQHFSKIVFFNLDDTTRLDVLTVSKEADLKGGSSMTRGKSLSLVNDQDS